MKAWLLKRCGNIIEDDDILELCDVPIPKVEPNEILIKIKASGVCHTELDEIEARTPPPKFPVILGHQISGVVDKTGKEVKNFKEGDRAAVAWIGSSCGKCVYCQSGLENLCDDFQATGRDINGGYAQYIAINENFAYKIEGGFEDEFVAPLLCAGAVGYRSLILTEIKDGEAVGFMGFGASAHLVLKLAKILFPASPIFVFARSEKERQFAKELGADWAGDVEEIPPKKPKAIIDTTPVWKPVIASLNSLQKGGRVVINAIRKESIDKEELLKLQYESHLWLEKEIKSVANVTRKDVEKFLDIAFKNGIKPEIQIYSFENAKKALIEIKKREIRGAKVLIVDGK
jgi:propanol-preferring alcohol dehydrogenase